MVERKNLPIVVEDLVVSLSVFILNIVNDLPYCPILFWVNKPKDLVSIEDRIIVSKMINPRKSNPKIAKDKSNRRFRINLKVVFYNFCWNSNCRAIVGNI